MKIQVKMERKCLKFFLKRNSKINIIKDKIEKNKSIDKNGEQILEMKYKDLENNLLYSLEIFNIKIIIN